MPLGYLFYPFLIQQPHSLTPYSAFSIHSYKSPVGKYFSQSSHLSRGTIKA